MHSHYLFSSPSPPLHSQPKQYLHIHTPTNTSTYIKNTTTLYTKITLQATSCPVPSNINTHRLKLFHAHLPPPPPLSLIFFIFHLTCLLLLLFYLRYIHPPLTFPLVYLSTWGTYTLHLPFPLFTCLPVVCTLTFPLSACLPVYQRFVHLHFPFLLANLSTWGVYS